MSVTSGLPIWHGVHLQTGLACPTTGWHGWPCSSTQSACYGAAKGWCHIWVYLPGHWPAGGALRKIVWTCGPANTAGGQLSTPTLQGCRYECPQGGRWRGLTVAPLLKASWSAPTPASRAISACKAPGRTPAVSSVGYPTQLWPTLLRHTSRRSPQMPPGIWPLHGQGLGSGQCAWHVFGCSPAAASLPPPWASGMRTFHLWRAPDVRRAQHFCSACNCGNWYSVVSGTYLPQGVPGPGCMLTGTTTPRVCALSGCHGPCSYCTFSF